jgi:hypothetical protein
LLHCWLMNQPEALAILVILIIVAVIYLLFPHG